MRWYSTYLTFVDNEIEEMLDRLDLWHENMDIGMTKEKYLEVQEQLGLEPDFNRCPPGLEDFPDLVINALNIFSGLGDRVYPDIGYVGKDYTNLPIFLQIYDIDKRDYDLVMRILSSLDSHVIKKSQQKLREEHNKMKSKRNRK